ncbi:MAG: Uncharacterized protein FD156_1775 [Nitrospirae bacterium]|nr:MAG: Uncharacterized protein FD156_1775 [Nitrospirota bacterium]
MKKKIAYSILLVVIYLGVLSALKHLDIWESRFYEDGFSVIVYIFLKVIFAGYFMMILLTSGVALQRIVLPKSDVSSVGFGIYLIACFFLGASALALLMLILGFLKAYYFATVIIITAPLVGLTPFILPSLMTIVKARFYQILKTLSPAVSLAYIALLISTVIIAIVLLLHKGIFPGELDSDVWMHYLHYYKEVSVNGNIWPNDLWYHFYLSKGAGLFFLASLLTDVMSPAIVSWCFVIITAIIVYDILSEHISYPLWPLLGALLVFLSLSAITNQYVTENTTSSFFKHHIILMGFIAFGFWCAIRFVGNLSHETAWLLGIVGALSFFYIGFYIPTTVIPLIAIWFFEVAVVSLFLQRKPMQARVFIGFAVAALFGSLFAFLINYSVTGLADNTPVSLMWKFADKERFGKLWSPWIIEYYFLASSFDSQPVILSNILKVDIHWIAQLCRTWFFKDVPLLSYSILLTAFIGAAYSRSSWKPVISANKRNDILYAALFIGNALLFAQFFKNYNSLFRLYNFTVIFVILFIILFWAAVLGPMSRYKPAIVAAVVLLSAGFFIKDLPLYITKNRTEALWQYVTGRISTKDAVADTDFLINSYIKNDTRFSHFIKANSYIRDGSKMLYMGQDCGPGYFFPAMVVSELSYALGNKYDVTLFGPPEEARSAYQRLGINYFALNLRRQFFVGLPFSPLFKAENVQKYLDLVWADGDFYLLAWKTENSDKVMPVEFLHKLEQKQLEESKTGWGTYYKDMYEKYNRGVHRD